MTTMPNVYGTGATAAACTRSRATRSSCSGWSARTSPLDGKDAKQDGRPRPDAEGPGGAATARSRVPVRNGTAHRHPGPGPRPGARRWRSCSRRRASPRPPPTRTTSRREDGPSSCYPSADLEGDAQAVAKALGIPLSAVKKSTDVSGVTLVVGADWREGTAYQAPAPRARQDPGVGATR